MPRRYPAEVRHQVIELARSGTKVAQLVAAFGMSDATIYNWLKQERVDRGEIAGLSTEEALDLAAAKRRIKQLETELAVSRTDASVGMGRAGSGAAPVSREKRRFLIYFTTKLKKPLSGALSR